MSVGEIEVVGYGAVWLMLSKVAFFFLAQIVQIALRECNEGTMCLTTSGGVGRGTIALGCSIRLSNLV